LTGFPDVNEGRRRQSEPDVRAVRRMAEQILGESRSTILEGSGVLHSAAAKRAEEHSPCSFFFSPAVFPPDTLFRRTLSCTLPPRSPAAFSRPTLTPYFPDPLSEFALPPHFPDPLSRSALRRTSWNLLSSYVFAIQREM